MRKDMEKVLRERPRRGSGAKNPQVIKMRNKKIKDDDVGGRAPLFKRSYSNDGQKDISLYFAPLQNFLKKAAREKRLWNDVYSEVCEIAKGNLGSKYTVKEVIGWLVDTNIAMINDVPFSGDGARKYYPVGRDGGFYVNPDTGVLHFVAYVDNWKANKSADELARIFKIVEGKAYALKNNIWYYLEWFGTPSKQIWYVVDQNGNRLREVYGDKPELPEYKAIVSSGRYRKSVIQQATSEEMVIPSEPTKPQVGSWKVSAQFANKGKPGQSIKATQVASKMQKRLSE